MDTQQITEPRRAFISYAREDVEWAKEIYRQLQRDEYEAFLDKRDLRNGDRWPERLKQAIAESDLFILLWSSFTQSSAWVKNEYRQALCLRERLKRPKIKIELWSKSDKSTIPPELQDIHYEISPLGRDKLHSLIQFEFNAFPSDRKLPPSHLLRAEYGIVPFWGRSKEREKIAAWYNSESKFGVLFLSGPAGIGKTRLMREICLQLGQQGWDTGFIWPGPLSDADCEVIDSLYCYRRPMLLVFDYAEVHWTRLRCLLQSAEAKRDGQPLRFVFVSRQEEWGEELRSRLPYGMIELCSLTPLGEFIADRDQLFWSATQAFARHKKVPLPRKAPDLTSDIFGRPLLIHMAALTSILGEGEYTPEELLDALIRHEEAHWLALAPGYGVPEHLHEAIRQLVVINTLLGGLPDVEEQQHPTWKTLLNVLNLERAELRNVSSVVRECYEVSGRIAPLQPDLLGEYFVTRELTRKERLLFDLVAAEDTNVHSVLKVLNSIAVDREEGATWINKVLLSNPSRFAEIALSVAIKVGDPIGQILTEMLRQNPNLQLAQRLEPLLPEYTVALRELRVVVVEQCLAHLRKSTNADDEIERARLASNLGAYLFDLGHFKRAIAVSRESVATYRGLIASGHIDYRSTLARSLDNLAIFLSALNQLPPDEAINAAKEAVSIYEDLVQNRNESVRAELAHSKNNLATILWETGDRKQAIKLMHDSIDLYRQLHATEPAKFSAELARCLTNLGKLYADLGKPDDACEAASEAVDLCRWLASDQPDAFSFLLATSLNTYANQLRETDQYNGAQDAAEEAVSIWRRLAKQRPGVFNQSLALALYDFGQILGSCTNWKKSVTVTQEAVDLYRELCHLEAEGEAQRANWYLAISLTSLGKSFRMAGQAEEALQASKEAVSKYRQLVASGVELCLPDLAIALHELSQLQEICSERFSLPLEP